MATMAAIIWINEIQIPELFPGITSVTPGEPSLSTSWESEFIMPRAAIRRCSGSNLCWGRTYRRVDRSVVGSTAAVSAEAPCSVMMPGQHGAVRSLRKESRPEPEAQGRRIHPRAFSGPGPRRDGYVSATSSSSALHSRSRNAAIPVDKDSPSRRPTSHHTSHRRNDHQLLSAC